jgi:pyruvate dehydrogenase E1 component alpha subunit
MKNIEKDRLVGIYTTMKRIRAFEEKAVQLFEENRLRGSVHLYIGEEAIAATVCSRLRKDDYITSTHRGHGHCIAKGGSLDRTLAELKGKETGYCKGRGGSMHIADPATGNLGANAIVGAGVPIAVGAALSARLRGSDQVAVAFFGDGASNQGVTHEAMNLASVWKLGVIFVCENNGFGISVPVVQSTSVQDVSVRAGSYNMPGCTVDGNDVFEIDAAFEKAERRARAGEGPSLIECKTYRWKGHWVGDPETYRTREEVEAWKAKCPIKRLAAYIKEHRILTEKELGAIDAEVAAAIAAAEKFAEESPEPDPARVMDNVFYTGAPSNPPVVSTAAPNPRTNPRSTAAPNPRSTAARRA